MDRFQYLTIVLALVLWIGSAIAGNIHEVDYANQAEVKIYRVKYQS